MATSNQVAVNEKRRAVYFRDGSIANFNNVKWFDASGTFLRLESDEGYILINTANVNYYKIPDINDKVI